MDSPLLAAVRGGNVDGRSPGLATLKDAFDIAYAVHRAEEEGARRRRYHGRGGVGVKGFLGDLNEEHEDGGTEGDTEDDERGRTRATQRQAHRQGKLPAQQGTDRTGTVGQGQKQKTTTGTGRKSKGFELDLHGATLLGRRHQKRVGSPLTATNPLTTAIEGMRVREM